MSEPQPTTPLDLEVADGIGWVRLNRPEAMNSLNTELKAALLGALRSVAADPGVRCVVLTGSGRAFCVGQDLKEHVQSLAILDQSLANLGASPDSTVSEHYRSLASTVGEHYNPIVTLLATMDKPVVAALGGVAAGAGLSFALACDFRIAVDTAGLDTSFASIALSCDSGASWTLPRLVGTAKAKELLMFPRTVPAAEALELGLLTKVVAAPEFESEVRAFARTLADGPTLAFGAIKRAVAVSAGASLAVALAHEAQLMIATGQTDDHRIAVDAFLAKERPIYTGR